MSLHDRLSDLSGENGADGAAAKRLHGARQRHQQVHMVGHQLIGMNSTAVFSGCGGKPLAEQAQSSSAKKIASRLFPRWMACNG
jgi:hypothetical protein